MSASSLPEAFYQSIMSLSAAAALFYLFIILAFSFYIAYLIRMWLVQTAMFDIRDSLVEISEHLRGVPAGESVQDGNHSVEELRNYVTKEERRAQAAARFEKLKPRRIYLWAAAAIPVLLIILVIVMSLR